MALYGSKRIRGHGIPEAIETILVGASKVKPKLTFWKPLSSAIAIGTGGPFGAEGPIILTGGAVGSVFAQFLRLSAIERRCLLVAGAAAGMAGIFGTPVAAVLLGIELLIFEWKPRSMVLIGLASGIAAALRFWFVNLGWMDPVPLFPTSLTSMISPSGLLDALILGILCGLGAWLVTKAVYAAEDSFKKLNIHWFWWLPIGGLVIGIGGLIEPRTLGVGYATIADIIAGNLAINTLIAIFVVKLVIWSIGLGSGTSGGILAPLLMMGGAMGAILGNFLPGATPADWAVLGMAGLLSGVTRSPFTSIVFAVELTHNVELLLPLLLTCTIAHLISVLILKRSILTEKVARRGFHVLREYRVSPTDRLFVDDVIETNFIKVASGTKLKDAAAILKNNSDKRYHRLIPVISDDKMIGVVPWQSITEKAGMANDGIKIDKIMIENPIVAYADESLHEVSDRMAVDKVGAMPVVKRENPKKLIGLITQYDLLAAETQELNEEYEREQIFHIPFSKKFPRLLQRFHDTRDEDKTETNV